MNKKPCPMCEMIIRPDSNFNYCPRCGRNLKREHIDSKDCWCYPTLDYVDPETGNEVWVHNHIQ